MMSGYLICPRATAVHIFTDAAIYDPNGVMIGKTCKTILLPQGPAALAFVGGRAWPLAMYADLSSCPSFDHFIDHIESCIDPYKPVVEAIARKTGSSADFEMIAAGYSQRNGCLQTFAMASREGIGVVPFRLRAIDYDCLNPAPSQTLVDQVGGIAGDLSTPTNAIAIFEAMRRIPHEFSPDVFGSAIGGFVQHTVLMQHEIRTNILRRWPDEIGKVIDPAMCQLPESTMPPA